jgi:tetratricopeptide (TPR) repeat protein
VAHYRVRIPEDARGPITFTAKLNYRKFAHSYTQFAYAGQPKPGQDPSLVGKGHNSLEYSYDPKNIPANVSGKIKDQIPNLPIVVVAETTAQIGVGDGKTPTRWQPVVLKADRERWNDWGIGMLLQGDIKGAEYAFTTATQAEPEYSDGWLNLARALIQEGETEAAKPHIQKAIELNPGAGRNYFFRAAVEKADGDYPAAIASLRRVVQQYPRDRVALNQLARILFLSRDYAESLKVLAEVAKVDPEDLQMHYTAMLAHRGAGNLEAAARAETLFKRFKAEESAQAITGDRRRARPEENNERQMIHEHVGVPQP